MMKVTNKTIAGWKNDWKKLLEEQMVLTVKEDYSSEQLLDIIEMLSESGRKLDELFKEFKYVANNIFQNDLMKMEYEDALKPLTDYAENNTPVYKKQISQNEHYAIHVDSSGRKPLLEVTYFNTKYPDAFVIGVNQKKNELFLCWTPKTPALTFYTN